MSAGRAARHRVEYLLVRAIDIALRPLPMRIVRRLGEALGAVAYHVAVSRRRVAFDNLERALPERRGEHEAIVRGMFAHFGRMLLELLRFGRLTDEEMRAMLETEGAEHVAAAYEAGRGMILVGGHLGYWEMQGITHPLCWKPFALMVRPLDNPGLHAMLEAARTRTGNAVIYRQGSIRKVLRALADNRAVGILIDQHLHSPEAIQVNFFGRPAATTSVVGALVRRTGAAVVPAFGLPLPGGRYRFVYGRAVEPPADDSPEAIRDFTQRCTDVIEEYVRRYPDLWLWMHRRWRDAPVPAAAGAEAKATVGGDPYG
jgi:KDO2-lipid IV(A) lauroyltransferase